MTQLATPLLGNKQIEDEICKYANPKPDLRMLHLDPFSWFHRFVKGYDPCINR